MQFAFVRRGFATLAGGAVVAGMVALGAGPAAAGGGPAQPECGGPGYAEVCAKYEPSGQISYWADTDFSNGNDCVIFLDLVEGDAAPSGAVSEPCGTGKQSHRRPSLEHPQDGHVYHAVLKVQWNGGRVDNYRSPDLPQVGG